MTHLDFMSAFLQGELDVPLFMEQPEGLKELLNEKGEDIDDNSVLRLKKGIYGLKQAGRIWYQSMSKGLMDLGFTRSPSDTCLFYILNPGQKRHHHHLNLGRRLHSQLQQSRVMEEDAYSDMREVHPRDWHRFRMVPRHGCTTQQTNRIHLSPPISVRPKPPQEIPHGRCKSCSNAG